AGRRPQVLAARDDHLRRGVRRRTAGRIHQAGGRGLYSRRIPGRLAARRARAGRPCEVRRGRGGDVRIDVLHDDGIPRIPRHVRPNYMLFWLYLFVMTIAEVLLAFELPVTQNLKLILLLILAVWKAMLVALFFMHLKFERWRLRLIFIVPLPLAAILVTTVIM